MANSVVSAANVKGSIQPNYKELMEAASSLTKQLGTAKKAQYAFMVVFFVVFALFGYFIVKIIYNMYDTYMIYREDVKNIQKLQGNHTFPNGDDGLDEYPMPDKELKYQDSYYIDDIDAGFYNANKNVVEGKMKRQIDYRKTKQPSYVYGANININNLTPDFDDYVYTIPPATQKSFWAYLFDGSG